MILTYSLRVRDKHSSELSRQARVVNFIWNYCNEVQRKAARERRRWLSDIDLNRLTAGTSKELNLNAQAIQQVAKQYVANRKHHKRAWLRFRSHRKSLGWIPFPNQQVRLRDSHVYFGGKWYQTAHWRPLPEGARLASGSFTADSRGRWYVNLAFEMEITQQHPHPGSKVGIDLGLKHLATLSDGTKFEAPKYYRTTEECLAAAQRARKPKLCRTLSARIANQRKDHAHKVSNEISKKYKEVYVGDISPLEIIKKPRLAKSVSDAGCWATLRAMLSYKSIREGGNTHVVSEAYSTQACSVCQILSGPVSLGIRVWTCGGCGTVLDRDTNAARNILRWGTPAPAEGIDCKGQSVHWMWMVIPAKCGRTSS